MPHDLAIPIPTIEQPAVVLDEGSPLIVNRLVGSRRLVAVAEPTTWTEDGADLAAATLEFLVGRVGPDMAAARSPIEQVLSDALDATNAWLLGQLRDWTGFRTEDRVGVGVGVAVMAAETTVFAVVAPAQAIVWQSGRRYDVPRLGSWLGAVESLGGSPLGLSDEIAPMIARTRAHLDDIVMVMTSATARELSELERRGDLPTTPDGILAEIEERYEDGAFGKGAQCLVAVGCAVPSGRFERSWRHVTEAASDLAWPTWIVHPRHRPSQEQVEWSVALPMDRYVTQSPSWREAAIAASRPRREVPLARLSRRRQLVSVVTVMLMLLGVVGWAIAASSAEERPESRYLGDAREAVGAAERSSRPGDIDRLLSDAEIALVQAEEDGAEAIELDPLYVQVQVLRDRLDHQDRLGPIEQLGRLPGNADWSKARLALHGLDLYVLDGALYRFDLEGRTLIQELAPGDQIEGITARPFRDVASDHTTLILTDGAGIFWRGEDGEWHATALAQPMATTDGRGELFDGNYYWLDPADDQVLRFGAGAYGDAPRHWIEDGNDVDLGRAVDMAVDGHVLLLQPNGTLVDLYRGHVVSEERLTLGGAECQALALARPAGGTATFVALDAVRGPAVLRIDAVTGDRVPYLPLARGNADYDATDDETLRGSVELVVDEAARTLYLIADGAIWVTTF